MNSEEISIYIHIPFCNKKCDYCDFYSLPAISRNVMFAYVDKLITELDFFIEKYRPKKVPTIYIGGGTPTSMPVVLLEKLIDSLKNRIPEGIIEWTVEANPETVTNELLEMMMVKGVNRLSVGFQSFRDEKLKTLGRNAGVSDNFKALETISSTWKSVWNGDLITDVPGETLEDIKKDIKKLTDYNPSHVSMYSLTLEPGTPLAKKMKNNFQLDTENISWKKASGLLELAGFERYEISNFSKKGQKCLHNIVYWKTKPFIGLGVAASSTLPGPGGPVRRINPSSLNNYMAMDFFSENQNDFGGSLENIKGMDFLVEFLMMGFRLIEGINVKRFENIFGKKIEYFIPGWIENNLEKCLIEQEAETLRLSEKSLDFLNPLIVDLWRELEKKNHPHGICPNWP